MIFEWWLRQHRFATTSSIGSVFGAASSFGTVRGIDFRAGDCCRKIGRAESSSGTP